MLSDLINPLHICIAFGPLAVYLMLLGLINLSSRPLVTNGARDTAALGVGISGFIMVGPCELLLPQATAATVNTNAKGTRNLSLLLFLPAFWPGAGLNGPG